MLTRVSRRLELCQWIRIMMSETETPPTLETSDAALMRFFRNSPGARSAAGVLRSGAEVGVTFTDVPGDWRFIAVDGAPMLEVGPPADPDFDLRLAPGAVRAICDRPHGEIGDLGVAFFERIVATDPEQKIRVTLRSGLVKLTVRGWLSVLAKGGPGLVGWLAKKGLNGPGAVASALARLRK
jgi:hypothetical protein